MDTLPRCSVGVEAGCITLPRCRRLAFLEEVLVSGGAAPGTSRVWPAFAPMRPRVSEGSLARLNVAPLVLADAPG